MFFVLKFELILIIGSAPAGAALDRAGLDNRLTDVSEVVSFFTPRKIHGFHFC
jgi:hypothetical protein